jgi:hypothetical protein
MSSFVPMPTFRSSSTATAVPAAVPAAEQVPELVSASVSAPVDPEQEPMLSALPDTEERPPVVPAPSTSSPRDSQQLDRPAQSAAWGEQFDNAVRNYPYNYQLSSGDLDFLERQRNTAPQAAPMHATAAPAPAPALLPQVEPAEIGATAVADDDNSDHLLLPPPSPADDEFGAAASPPEAAQPETTDVHTYYPHPDDVGIF